MFFIKETISIDVFQNITILSLIFLIFVYVWLTKMVKFQEEEKKKHFHNNDVFNAYKLFRKNMLKTMKLPNFELFSP